MAVFGAYGTKAAVVTAGLGPLSIEAGATARRGKLLTFSIGCSDAPTDHEITLQLQRQTATGTGTGFTVVPVDQGDVAGNITAVAKSNLTVTPTIPAALASLMFKRSFNTKYGFDYFPPPGGEIVYPATAASGIVWDTPIAANADNLTLYATVQEQ